jgi:hypothetical protein
VVTDPSRSSIFRFTRHYELTGTDDHSIDRSAFLSDSVLEGA